MTYEACPVCGGPATAVRASGIRMVGCARCVPDDRAYMIPVGDGETPLIARPHLPEGIIALKFEAKP